MFFAVFVVVILLNLEDFIGETGKERARTKRLIGFSVFRRFLIFLLVYSSVFNLNGKIKLTVRFFPKSKKKKDQKHCLFVAEKLTVMFYSNILVECLLICISFSGISDCFRVVSWKPLIFFLVLLLSITGWLERNKNTDQIEKRCLWSDSVKKSSIVFVGNYKTDRKKWEKNGG